MKITQAQYFEIKAFFTEKCRLVETEFIEEMTDHFIDAIERKLTESIPFEIAINSTNQDFGGPSAIQKMEWQYRKGFSKKQIRVIWALEKSQFAGLKLLRTSIVSVIVTSLCIYLGFYNKDVTDSYNMVSGFLSSGAIVPALTLPLFFLQRYIKWLDIFGVVKFQMVVRVCITFLLLVIAVLLSREIKESGFSILANALLNSSVWSTLAVSYIASIEYNHKYERNYWFTTK